jgi:hypothetical protein
MTQITRKQREKLRGNFSDLSDIRHPKSGPAFVIQKRAGFARYALKHCGSVRRPHNAHRDLLIFSGTSLNAQGL